MREVDAGQLTDLGQSAARRLIARASWSGWTPAVMAFLRKRTGIGALGGRALWACVAALLIACLAGCDPGSGGTPAGTAESTETQPTRGETDVSTPSPAEGEVATTRDERSEQESARATAAGETAGLVALDLGLTVDAVTRATPGNPRGVKPPHLREEVKREPFLVPEGVENVALYQPATCSEEELAAGDLDQLTDDIKQSGPFDFVELGTGLHWVQIDLGQVRAIHAVAIWHYYKNPTIYNDVIVQVADDPAFQENVRTLFNNDHDNSAKLGRGKDTAFYTRWWAELVDARGPDGTPTRARYVRVYTAGGMEGEPVRFVEIGVYGT
jgi:hypothetical protein